MQQTTAASEVCESHPGAIQNAGLRQKRNLYMPLVVGVLNAFQLQAAQRMHNFIAYAGNRGTIGCGTTKQQHLAAFDVQYEADGHSYQVGPN